MGFIDLFSYIKYVCRHLYMLVLFNSLSYRLTDMQTQKVSIVNFGLIPTRVRTLNDV